MRESDSDTGRLPLFDRFASAIADKVSHAWFFMVCVLLVVVWVPSIILLDVDTWQLVINTLTTIITFLLVALLQNTQTRSDAAVQRKLNAIADALADLMSTDDRLRRDSGELLAAVGLEKRVSSDDS